MRQTIRFTSETLRQRCHILDARVKRELSMKGGPDEFIIEIDYEGGPPLDGPVLAQQMKEQLKECNWSEEDIMRMNDKTFEAILRADQKRILFGEI